jgi:hypothetical protein
VRRRLMAMATGVGVAALPVLAAAQDRAQDPPGDVGTVVLYTFLGLAGIFIVAGIGYLYRRERNIEWEFQRPDPPHDEHH